MRRDEAQLRVRIVHSDAHRALVSGDAGHARLLDASLNVFDLVKRGGPHEDAEGGADELPTSEKDLLLASYFFGFPVKRLLDGALPLLFPRRVAIHDLLGAELDDLLEPDNHNLGLCGTELGGPDPWR